MLRSMTSDNIGLKEFELIRDQAHLDKVWGIMMPIVQEYIDNYLDVISRFKILTPKDNYSIFLSNLIKDNDKLNQKYLDVFDLELFEEEYSEDVDGFKNSILKKECEVIYHSLQAKTDALNDWKAAFYECKGQRLYDAFYNMMKFAYEYDQTMTEDIMNHLNTIKESGLAEMEEDSCYLSGVLGFGIVSNILNHMYPRVFPGNYKAGIYALHFLTGKKGEQGIDMPSESSEFCMIKDDVKSKTGIIEIEHNYFYPYEVFDIYTLRIFREIEKKINERFSMYYPTEYRFLLTNDFYDYVTSVHKEDIITFNGNDDLLKFGYAV